MRALDGVPWFGILGHNSCLDHFNTEIAHEQILFKDGTNVGFFKDGKIRSDVGHKLSDYREADCGYNDCVLKKAVDKTKTHSYCLLGFSIKKKKFNCQDWADSVRHMYSKLVKDSKIQCECKVKRSEIK